MDAAAYTLRQAAGAADMEAARRLFRAYGEELGVDLHYQGFEDELATLPGAYAPPAGDLIFAQAAAGEIAGCVALRAHEPPAICEMKRFFVVPAHRGAGLGRRLVAAILRSGMERGYERMYLDTLERLAPAFALYQAFGFQPIAPYYEGNPIAGVIYMEKVLSRS